MSENFQKMRELVVKNLLLKVIDYGRLMVMVVKIL